MSCEIGRRLVESGESAAAVQAHTASCLSCAIGEKTRYYEAPAGLEQKIRARLKDERRQPVRRNWWAAAAVALLAVSGALTLDLVRQAGNATETAVLSAHLRSLEGTHLLDVPSSDQHTVKPWFNGKLDFSPAVPSFPDFPLLGGRLEYLEGHPAAALIYGRGQHIINLFIWHGNRTTREKTGTTDGYHFINWTQDGMNYWAVSDVNTAELERFTRLYRAN
jgi:anti-sigma factor RsiW